MGLCSCYFGDDPSPRVAGEVGRKLPLPALCTGQSRCLCSCYFSDEPFPRLPGSGPSPASHVRTPSPAPKASHDAAAANKISSHSPRIPPAPAAVSSLQRQRTASAHKISRQSSTIPQASTHEHCQRTSSEDAHPHSQRQTGGSWTGLSRLGIISASHCECCSALRRARAAQSRWTCTDSIKS